MASCVNSSTSHWTCKFAFTEHSYPDLFWSCHQHWQEALRPLQTLVPSCFLIVVLQVLLNLPFLAHARKRVHRSSAWRHPG